jgi:hypothetical protein
VIADKLLRAEPRLSTQHLASGSFVVASKTFAEWLRSANADIHGAEMEAAGMLTATEQLREPVTTLVVRGISDHVDADKAEIDRIGDGALRRLAMRNAWGLVTTLMQLGKLPRSRSDDSAEARPPRISRTRLPAGAPILIGRETELAWLDRAWDEPGIRVATIVAFGGVGKTALVGEWRRALRERGAVDCVFEWSFYSEGVDNFLVEALRWFGEEALAESNASPWDKGARLAAAVRRQRALLILDGLEPLQYPSGAKGLEGKLKDAAIEALLNGLATQNTGLCVVTTRTAVRELKDRERSSAPRLELERLSRVAGGELLRVVLEPDIGARIQSTTAEREDICEAVKGHALTLELLGSYIQRALGDVRRWGRSTSSVRMKSRAGMRFG